MVTKTTGAEFKRFYSDQSFWPSDAYTEDEELMVNGHPFDQYADPTTIDDSALMTVAGGIVYLKAGDTDGPSLEAYFKRWRKVQTTVFLSIEVSKDKVDAVVAAIEHAGGKVSRANPKISG